MNFNKFALHLVALIAAAVSLPACGGGGDAATAHEVSAAGAAAVAAPGPITVPPTAWFSPIVYNFDSAGVYVLTVTGQFTVTQFTAPDSLGVWFDYSGQGLYTSGSAEPQYAVTAKDQVIPINQTVTLTVKEAGPWQMRVTLRSWGFAGVMSNLALQTVKQ